MIPKTLLGVTLVRGVLCRAVSFCARLVPYRVTLGSDPKPGNDMRAIKAPEQMIDDVFILTSLVVHHAN